MKKWITFVATLLGLSGFNAALAEPIKIGVAVNLTGAYAAEGQDARRVIELMVEQINAQGGINGDPIELIIGDDGSNPRTSAIAATRLVEAGVKASAGSYTTASTEAAQDIFDEAGVVQIGTGSTAVHLTEKGLRHFFRTAPRDDTQGQVTGTKLMELGFKKFAILSDNTSYSKGLADETEKQLRALGGNEIVFRDEIVPGQSDYSVVLTRMRSAEPDVIYFSGFYSEAGLMLRQKREMGWDTPLIGGDGTNHADLVTVAGKDAAAGYRFFSPPLPMDLDSPAIKTFLQTYYERYDAYPGSIWSINHADAFGVIVAAIRAVGNDSDAIADYLHNDLKDYEGFSGKISFDEKGDRVGDFYRFYEIDSEGRSVLQPQ